MGQRAHPKPTLSPCAHHLSPAHHISLITIPCCPPACHYVASRHLVVVHQAEAAKEAQLKGPHSFTLQRLLHIYKMLRRADPGAACDVTISAAGGSSAAAAAAAVLFGGGSRGGGGGTGSGGWMLTGDDDVSPLDIDGATLLSSVAGLVGRRLLSGGGSGEDALGAPRYQCDVPAAVVERMALELRINLAAYLKYV